MYSGMDNAVLKMSHIFIATLNVVYYIMTSLLITLEVAITHCHDTAGFSLFRSKAD